MDGNYGGAGLVSRMWTFLRTLLEGFLNRTLSGRQTFLGVPLFELGLRRPWA